MTDLPSDYFHWLQRKLLKDKPQPDREEPSAPSEPIQVDYEERNASTTIIERLYAVLGKRS